MYLREREIANYLDAKVIKVTFMTGEISSFKFTVEIIMEILGCNPFWA